MIEYARKLYGKAALKSNAEANLGV